MSEKEELIELFRERARAGELPALLEAHATFNLKSETLGGTVFWTTYEEDGWKLQFNDVSNWWRILDSRDVRRARATTLKQLRNLLEDRPATIVSNFFDSGHRFSKLPVNPPTGRSVILIHGWGVRAWSMQNLAAALASQGYDTYNYDYPSSLGTIEEHVATFLEQFRDLLSQFPENEEIFFLTHSMGGLLLRGVLAQLRPEEAHRIQAIVMLGPPNRGSGLAYFGKMPGVANFNRSLKDMTPSADSYVMNIPPPSWLPPTGIIAGSHDGKVAIPSTHLPEGQEHMHLVVDATHPGLRNPATVLPHILHFFQNKKF